MMKLVTHEVCILNAFLMLRNTSETISSIRTTRPTYSHFIKMEKKTFFNNFEILTTKISVFFVLKLHKW